MAIFMKTIITESNMFLTILVLFLIYLWFRRKFSYWSRRGVIGPEPVFPFGNIKDVIRRKAQFFQPYCDNYFKYKHLPYIGMYSFYRPVLCINDLEIAKLLLIKDFDHFQSHGIFSGGDGDPLAGHLFNLSGSAWKNLRLKMSPTFTVGKLKSMFPLVEKVANSAVKYLEEKSCTGASINYSEFAEKYTMEIIGSVGFGVECNGFNNPNSDFYKYGHAYFEPKSWYWTLTRALAFFVPDLFNISKMKRIDPDIINFFYSLVKETVEYRENHFYKRNDFLQTLIDLKNGQVEDETAERKQRFSFTMQDVAANTMLYMFAGYETSATTGQLAVYEMARHPELQQRARDEVNKVLAKYDGQCSYEAQNEMVYLNMVLDETMRKYPPMRSLFRGCTKTYELSDGLIIEKGTLVLIPVHAIQMDPELYPDPERFDPDRFAPERKAKLHPCQWMPFGEGPRKCIGLRQGYIQSKMALVKLLPKYEFILDPRTPVPGKFSPSSMTCAMEGGIWIKLQRLEK